MKFFSRAGEKLFSGDKHAFDAGDLQLASYSGTGKFESGATRRRKGAKAHLVKFVLRQGGPAHLDSLVGLGMN